MTNCNFSLMLLHIQNYGQSRRTVFNANTVLEIYNDKIVQLCTTTQIRSQYIPSDEDLQADDWELIFFEGDEGLHKNHLLNAIIDQERKFSSQLTKKSLGESDSYSNKTVRRIDKILWFSIGFMLSGIGVLLILILVYEKYI